MMLDQGSELGKEVRICGGGGGVRMVVMMSVWWAGEDGGDNEL
jgi:hypothetical protein